MLETKQPLNEEFQLLMERLVLAGLSIALVAMSVIILLGAF
jgi:hypothetical protein